MAQRPTGNKTLTLEAENRKLRNLVEKMAAEARSTGIKQQRFHACELSLLMAEDLPQLLQRLTRGMREFFSLACVSLVLQDRNHELRHLLLSIGKTPKDFDGLLFTDCLEALSPVYYRLSRPWLGPFQGTEHLGLFGDCRMIRSVALLPLVSHGVLVGSLNLGSPEDGRFTRHHGSDFLHHLATIGAVCLENAANRQQLVVSGLTDALTGMYNRRYLEQRIDEEVARARRYDYPLSCLFIDADHFKQINDCYGHSAGDQVLREISLRVQKCLRSSDIATRFGGEEFALLLPQSSTKEAFALAERIRQRIAGQPFSITGNELLQVSVSIGVSELENGNADHARARMLAEADSALYTAKRQGRNRVAVFSPLKRASDNRGREVPS